MKDITKSTPVEMFSSLYKLLQDGRIEAFSVEVNRHVNNNEPYFLMKKDRKSYVVDFHDGGCCVYDLMEYVFGDGIPMWILNGDQAFTNIETIIDAL